MHDVDDSVVGRHSKVMINTTSEANHSTFRVWLTVILVHSPKELPQNSSQD